MPPEPGVIKDGGMIDHPYFAQSSRALFRFVHPRTVLTAAAFQLALALPSVGVLGLLSLLGLGKSPFFSTAIATTTTSAILGYLISRFALTALRGDIGSGFLASKVDPRESTPFASR